MNNEQKILDLMVEVKTQMVTKEDLAKLATKEEFVKSQENVTKKLNDLEIEQKSTNRAIVRINDTLSEFRADYDSSTNQIVDLLLRWEGKQEGMEEKVSEHDKILTRVKTQLKIA